MTIWGKVLKVESKGAEKEGLGGRLGKKFEFEEVGVVEKQVWGTCEDAGTKG